MSADSAVTIRRPVHSEAVLEYFPYLRILTRRLPNMYIPEPEHPEDLVPAEDEAPIPPLPPSFLAPHSRGYAPPSEEATATTPRTGVRLERFCLLLLLRQPGTHYKGPDFENTETRIMTALELVNRRVTYQVDVCTRESSEFCTRHHDAQKDRAAVRAEIEILRRERLAYEQEGMETRQALARSEAHCRALEARVTVLETEARRHEWQRQAADDLAVQHIMRTQALEAGARIDTLEDTGLKLSKEIAGLQMLKQKASRNDCSLHGGIAHVKTTTTEAAHAIAMASTEENETDKYCPKKVRSKKIETECGNLRQKGNERNDDLSKNNQNQQNKRQNTGQAYTAGNSGRKSYAGSKPLCSKCNYNHEGPCPPRCNNCKRVGHLTQDCRSRPANANNNNNNNRNNNNNNRNNNNNNQTITTTTTISRVMVALSAEIKATLKETAQD
ncbi:putative reverse transcriptase domain-containing protein [Tanacetum coccineum]